MQRAPDDEVEPREALIDAVSAAWAVRVSELSHRQREALATPALRGAVGEVLAALFGLVARTRGAATVALGEAGDARAAVERLRRMLADEAPELRALALLALRGAVRAVEAASDAGPIVSDVGADVSAMSAEASDAPASRPAPGSAAAVLRQVGELLGRVTLVELEGELGGAANLAQRGSELGYAVLYERMRQLAVTDALTGLYNYGYLRDRLRDERRRAARYQRLLSLVLFDIDHFKHFNDTNGHPAGNDVLRAVSQVLSGGVRDVDLVARFGGEEFALLLPEVSRAEARALADRLRAQIAATPFPHGERQPGGRLTVSAGVATFPVDAASDEQLVEMADQALYRAKRGGRDRVEVATPAHVHEFVCSPADPVSVVHLVGSFNGWDPQADPMEARGDGTFCARFGLAPGRYSYKFVLDGERWEPDPSAAETANDGLGGRNSVLRIPDVSGESIGGA